MFRSKFVLILVLILISISCQKDSEMSETGTGGSMARFAIKGDYLYTVDYEKLHTFQIESNIPVSHLQEQYLGFGIETIFPSGDNLFIGAQNGMHIYGISNPANPVKKSFTPHFVSYDPVVVEGDFAYVTLRSEQTGSGRNALLIFDVSKTSAPQLIMEYEMEGPRGLGIDQNILFICDDVLKVYSVTNGTELELIDSFDIPAIDVIPEGNTLFIVAEDGLYQYRYQDSEISFISKITMPYEEKP